ncbi:MAG TPA: type II methionyl aminopeptidase [Candidatus Nanoarchaeia archaeon]|nr:type II methionyl aminopeptidase [Candidatus Nanoarchaeia archaeon]
MDPQTKHDFIKAGKISAEAIEYGKTLITKGNSLLETTELIEKKIFELGGKPAFPVQISCDDIAAHFCAMEDDLTIFENQVVCLDLGVHVNGAIGDTAYTIDLSGKYSDLVQAAQKALEEALKIVNVGTELREIGKTIQDAIKSYGFNPVRNLSGHGLGLYDIHTSPTLPNFDNGDKTKLKENMTFAIEPFSTTGAGIVGEKGHPTVFMMQHKRNVRSPITRQVLKEIESYENLPFAERWLTRKFGAKANFALRELSQLGMIHQFPPLVETSKGLVAQAEHSILIDENGEVIVLTKL